MAADPARLPASGDGPVPALHDVALPDLSRMTESAALQEQVREQFGSFQRTTADPAMSPAQRADAYGGMGMLLMAARYLSEAEPYLLNAQMLAGEDRRWPYYLGHLYRMQGAVADAAASFRHALRLQPDDVATLVWLGEMALLEGRPDTAAAFFGRARSARPSSVASVFGLGRAALASDDLAGAIAYLEEVLAIDPEADVHYVLAQAYRRQGDEARAESQLRQRGASVVRPRDPLMQELDTLLESALAYEVRGSRALEAGDARAAAAYFRRGLELAPDSASLRHKLGTALFVDGEVEGGMTAFEQVVRTSPAYAKGHYSLGVLEAADGRLQPALDRLSEAVRRDPSYVEARLALADLLRRSGEPEAALAQYDRVLEIDPRALDAAFGRAMTSVALGNFRDAAVRLTEAIDMHPGEPFLVHALVRVLAAAPDDRVRDGARAMSLLQTLSDDERRLDPEAVAMALAEAGEYAEAAVWQRAAIAGARETGRVELADRMEATLVRYQSNRSSRAPWRDGEVP